MLSYFLISGCAYIASTFVVQAVVNKKAKEMGYVRLPKEDKPSLLKQAFNLVTDFIPVINNIATLLLIGSTILFLKNEEVAESALEKSDFKKASETKKIIEYKQKFYNLDAMQDAMRLDGADEATIKSETVKAKEALNLPSQKEIDKINAMSDAELWLLDVETNVGLTEKEKKELYRDYVRDFANKSSDAKAKAPEKTLRIISSINRW